MIFQNLKKCCEFTSQLFFSVYATSFLANFYPFYFLFSIYFFCPLFKKEKEKIFFKKLTKKNVRFTFNSGSRASKQYNS